MSVPSQRLVPRIPESSHNWARAKRGCEAPQTAAPPRDGRATLVVRPAAFETMLLKANDRLAMAALLRLVLAELPAEVSGNRVGHVEALPDRARRLYKPQAVNFTPDSAVDWQLG